LNSNRSIGILLIAFVFLIGCKAKKTLQLSEYPGLSEKQIVALFDQQPNFDFFSAKAKIKITTDQSSDKATLYIRAQPDSIFWLAGKRLSVEGGRLQINDTTATFINRLDRTYQIIPLDTFQESYGIVGNLSYIQDLFFGVIPAVNKEAYWKVERDSLHWTIKTMAQNVLHSFHLDPYTGELIGGKFFSKQGYDGHWTYSDHREIGENYKLPYYRKYELNISDESYLSVELQFSEITLDEPKRIKFDIPSQYTRVR